MLYSNVQIEFDCLTPLNFTVMKSSSLVLVSFPVLMKIGKRHLNEDERLAQKRKSVYAMFYGCAGRKALDSIKLPKNQSMDNLLASDEMQDFTPGSYRHHEEY